MSTLSLNTATRLLSKSPRDALDEFRRRWVPESYRWADLRRGDSPPKAPGIYVWFATRTVEGSDELVVRYVGESGDIRKRIRGRYVGGPQGPHASTILLPQLLLARRDQTSILQAVGRLTTARYMRDMKEVQAKGVEALEQRWPGLRGAYERNHPTPVRLDHAVDFALHGGVDVNALRVVLLEAPADQHGRRQLETHLFDLFTEANRASRLPKLLETR